MRIFDIRLFYDPRPDTRPSPQHLTCEMLRERIGDEKYNSYYKFSFVRNPWARLLSSYFWRQTLPKERPVLPFDVFVDNARQVVVKKLYYEQEFGDHFIPQAEYTRDVDDVFRYESFDSGVITIASRLGIPPATISPKTPKHYDNYWEFYDDSTREIVANTYRDEIDEFGYEFGPEKDSNTCLQTSQEA